MHPVENGVASCVEAPALASRVELSSRGKGREQFVAVRIQALGVLVSLRRPRTLALRRAHHPGNTARHRRPPRVLENRRQSQNLPGPHRRFRVVGPQVAVL